MRILFVSPWIPGPMRPRAYGLLQQLAAEHDVWVVSLQDRDGNAADVERLPGVRISVCRWSKLRGAVRAALSLFRRKSLQVAVVNESRMHREIRRVIDVWQPELVYFNVIRSAGLLSAVPPSGPPIVFDLDEQRSEYYRQLAASPRSGVWRAVGKLEHRALADLEIDTAGRVAATAVSSPVDVGIFGAAAHLVRSPHDVQFQGHDPQAADMVFVGRMSYHANVVAITSFIESALPRIREIRPDSRLRIVGANPPPALIALRSQSVEVTGRVESVDPYYANSAVALVPVELGTGVQMKLIQALAAGTPVVCTTECARRAGLELDLVSTADSPQEWVDRTLELLNDPQLRLDRSRMGLEWADRYYSDDAIGHSLNDFIWSAVR